MTTTTPTTFWRVSGFRQLGGGASVTMTATVTGATEADARRTFHSRVNKPTISNGLDRLPWHDGELTFTKV